METSKSTKKKKEIRDELREKTAGYILTALGLVAGLAWNDAISTLIKYFFPLDTNSILPKFIYAILITIVIVLLSNWLLNILTKKEEELK